MCNKIKDCTYRTNFRNKKSCSKIKASYLIKLAINLLKRMSNIIKEVTLYLYRKKEDQTFLSHTQSQFNYNHFAKKIT